MTRISLETFINKTKGKKLGLPWSPKSQVGQCVSLIQHYIKDCLEQPAKPRGHAKEWITNYVQEGLGKVVKSPKKGDILVFPKEAGNYGHIAIYIDSSTLYDQNNGRHDNYKAGYGSIFSKNYVILRPNVELISDVNSYAKGNYKTLDNMRVRTGPGTNYSQKQVKDLTTDGKKNATSQDVNSLAAYKTGTIFTAQEVIYKNGVWAKTPSGYVCIEGVSGKVYCKKI